MAKIDKEVIRENKDSIWKGKKKEERQEQGSVLAPNEVLFLVKYVNGKYRLSITPGNGKIRELKRNFFGHEECSNEIAKQLILWKNTV